MKHIPLYIVNITTICLLALVGAGLVKLTYPFLSIMPATLVVITPQHEASTGLLTPFGVGYERELIEQFWASVAEKQGDDSPVNIEWRSAPSLHDALELIRTGQGHIAAGFGSDAGSVSTAGNPADAVSVEPQGVRRGPVYQHASMVFAPLPSLEKSAQPAEDSTLHMLDARSWSVWEPFVGALASVDKDQGDDSPREAFRWFWTSQNPVLNSALQTFWLSLSEPTNTVLEQLEERYFGYLPDSPSTYAVMDFLDLVRKRLPRYSAVIAQAAERVSMDPLLFTAVIIQESRLNEGTVSHTGVQGIMQLTRDTAKYLKVDRLNPTQALRGGARYLRMIWSDLEGQGLEEWDRWFFTLAAFNQGPRRLEGARQLSRKLGGSGDTWRELKEVFPLLSQTKYAAMVGQTTCRGQEAVQFVERVRWYYHILRGIITLDRPEAQNLAPLLSSPIAGAALGF